MREIPFLGGGEDHWIRLIPSAPERGQPETELVQDGRQRPLSASPQVGKHQITSSATDGGQRTENDPLAAEARREGIALRA